MSSKVRILRSLILEINKSLTTEASEDVIRKLNLPGIDRGLSLAKTTAAGKPVTYVRDVGDKYIYAAIGGNQDLANFEPDYYICIYDGMRSDKDTFGKKFLPDASGYKPSSLQDFYSVNPSEINKLSKPVKTAVIGSALGLKKAYGDMNTYQYITQQVRAKTLPAGETVAQTPPALETSPTPPAAGASDPAAADAIAKDAVGVASTPGGSSDNSLGGTAMGGTTTGAPGERDVASLPTDPDGDDTEDDEEDDTSSDDTGGGKPGKKKRKFRWPKFPKPRAWVVPHIPLIPSLEYVLGGGWMPGGGGKGRRGDGEGSSGSSGARGRDTSPDDAERILGKEMDPFVREYLKLTPAEKDLLVLLRETYTTQTPNPNKTLDILKKIPSYGSSQGNIYGAFVANRPGKGDDESRKSALKQFKKIGIYNGEEIIAQARSVYVAGATLDRAGARGRFSADRPSMLETLGTIIACYGYFDRDKIFDRNFVNHRSPLVKEIARIYGFPEYEIESVMADVM